jgi:hypothetical protein
MLEVPIKNEINRFVLEIVLKITPTLVFIKIATEHT